MRPRSPRGGIAAPSLPYQEFGSNSADMSPELPSAHPSNESYNQDMSLMTARSEVVDDSTLGGIAFCRALSGRVDEWLQALYHREVGDRGSVALVAVGGYGREELSPHSDLDVMLVHDLQADEIAEVASGLWYPIWDEGAKLGHSVRTVREAMALAKSDLDTATSLLGARYLAGDERLAAKLASAATSSWRRQSRRWLQLLEESLSVRHRRAGEVAFMLEPDLKDGRGGLRDVHALCWAAQADRRSGSLAETGLLESYETLLSVRVELHREAGRRGGDVLLLEQQDAVAARLGYESADEMMADVAGSARRIAWRSDQVWRQLMDNEHRLTGRLRRNPVVVGGPGVTIKDSRVHLEPTSPVTPEAVLRVAAAAAHHGARLAPATVDRFEGVSLDIPDPWPAELRKLFIDLLRAGHEAIPIIETLDQLGLFVPFIPEWQPNRSRPQRNAYHRFTVDRHLWETAAEAARLIDQVDRSDLLLVGALLHDIGKGYPGDHTVVGMELIATIAPRMGFPPEDVVVLVAMCEHHLLLPDVATRRDLDDDDTIDAVADAVGSLTVLWLLAALTEADSIATGPAAWSVWKAGLVRDLAARAAYVLEGGDAGELPRIFPTDEHRQAMRRGTISIKAEGELLTVMAIDRPGVFSRVAGAVALHGLQVLDAAAHSEYGIAVAMFRVQPSFETEIDWDLVCRSVEDALHGRIALAARIDERIRTYAVVRPADAPQRIVETKTTIDNTSSSSATVLEVASRSSIGLLYYVTRALSQLDLDIASAKVQTLGGDVVDSFYLRDRQGNKIEDTDQLAEIDLAIRHALRLSLSPLGSIDA